MRGPTPSTFRTLGQHSSVNIVNSSHVEHAALMADKACGADTRLILYMDVGEVLSRSFTAKDTHTPQGDLIVAFTNAEGSHVECNRRATGTGILLGFSSPCFAFGGDLILPVESNEQLREVFRSNNVLQRARRAPHIRIGGEDDVDDQLAGDLAAVAEAHREYATVNIPEVCGCCSTTARMSARDPIEQTGTYPPLLRSTLRYSFLSEG